MTGYRTVIVGTDGSRSSFTAVERAAAVAASGRARLLIVCAYRPMRRQDVIAAEEALRDETYQVVGSAPAEETLRAARDLAAAAGAQGTELLAVEGDAVPVLLRAARKHSAELLVVGNRGLNTLAGRLLGAVPSEVARRADVDVLIVHTT
jgi:nucleotide-binding universal stress UspA family protein